MKAPFKPQTGSLFQDPETTVTQLIDVRKVTYGYIWSFRWWIKKSFEFIGMTSCKAVDLASQVSKPYGMVRLFVGGNEPLGGG